ncbi:hypothetical protein ACN28S_26595 [Cystobacter fuscus]
MKGVLAGLALALGGCGGLDEARESQPGFSGVVPAQVQHCAVKAVAFQPGEEPPLNPPPAKLDCFASFAEAIAFATQGAIQLPPDATPGQLTPELVSAPDATPTQNLIAVEYEDAYYGGRSLTFYSETSCYQSNLGTPSLSSDWNDIISSAQAFSGCNNSYHYEHVNYQGAVANCGSACTWIGDAMNDRTSSILWTR